MLASPGELTVQQVLNPEPSFTYPPAEASHEEVVNNSELFNALVKKVHDMFGVTEKYPRIGGRELDLHMLYRNVTALGGCERVIQAKHWREAAESFHYPETITSVSYSLRKAYATFLWDFEQTQMDHDYHACMQMYYFRNLGMRVMPPQQSRMLDGDQQDYPAEGTAKTTKKRKMQDVIASTFVGLAPSVPTALVATSIMPGQPEGAMVGSKGSVTLDSRFDAGYFCTVKVGRLEFKGMLYFPPPEHTVDPTMLLMNSRRPGRPRKLEGHDHDVATRLGIDRAKDPHAPKPSKTPFNFFSLDARSKAKESFPELTQPEVTKRVGEMWAKASDEEKAAYIAMSNQDKQRYSAEMEAYNYRIAAQAASQQAQQAAQAVSQTQQYVAQQPLQVNGEYFGHGTMPMGMADHSQQHHQHLHLHQHHHGMTGMQMSLHPVDGLM